jgi:hypothetical protein
MRPRPKLRVKLLHERGGKCFALYIPLIRGSDGELTMSLEVASAAAFAIQQEAYPELHKDRSPKMGPPRKHKRPMVIL